MQLFRGKKKETRRVVGRELMMENSPNSIDTSLRDAIRRLEKVDRTLTQVTADFGAAVKAMMAETLEIRSSLNTLLSARLASLRAQLNELQLVSSTMPMESVSMLESPQELETLESEDPRLEVAEKPEETRSEMDISGALKRRVQGLKNEGKRPLL